MNPIQNYLVENFIFLIIVFSTYFVVSVKSSVDRDIKVRMTINMTLLLLISINAFYLGYLNDRGISSGAWVLASFFFYALRPLPMVAMIRMVDKKKAANYIPAGLNALVYLTCFSQRLQGALGMSQNLADFLAQYTCTITEWVYWIIFLFVLNMKLYKVSNKNPLGAVCFISVLMTANILDSAGIRPGILVKTYAISFLLYYLMIHVYISQQVNREKDIKLREQRLSMMLSQIQPHFLYNTLNTITALCRTNPKLAEETTVKFSKYLRENMYGVDSREVHPFSQELDHIKIYLDIEKLRFGSRLNIVYDIQSTDFDVPVLTLQPIVENAVKHGICKRLEGGTVEIKSQKIGRDHIITIIDDGEGFDPERVHLDGKKHIGIANAYERLKNTAKAQMDIESMPGFGTKVRILIPGEREKIQRLEGERREIHSIGR